MSPQPVRTQPAAAGRLVACLLAFSAALLVLSSGLGWAYLEEQPGERAREASASASDSVRLVGRFYETVNATIATGDATGLADLVDPRFAELPARPGVPDGRDGLLQMLLAIRATAPTTRIVVESAVASAAGDQVTVRLRATGIGSGSFLGQSLPGEQGAWGWGPLELARIADGRIAERWSGQPPPALLRPLAKCGPLPAGGPTALDVVALLRLTIVPGAEIRFATGRHARCLVAESGATDGTTRTQTLEAASAVMAPAGSELGLANAGGHAASLVMVVRYTLGLGPLAPDGIAAPARAEAGALGSANRPEIGASVLSVGVLPHGAQLGPAFGRVAMPAESTLTWPAGPAVLLAVDAGSLTLATDGVATEGIRADGERWFGDDAVLEVGDGASIPAASGVIWRTPVGTPADVLVLTLAVTA